MTHLEDALSTRKLEPESNLKKGWSPSESQLVGGDGDNDAHSRNRSICDVLYGHSVVGDDYLLGQKCLRSPAGASLLEAHVADTESISYMDREQSPSSPTSIF